MDERFKNLVIILVGLLLVVGIVFIFSQSNNSTGAGTGPPVVSPVGSNSFQSEFAEMQKIWLEAGLNVPFLHSSKAVLESYETETLETVKKGLDSFAASASNESAKKLALLYSVLIQKKLQDKKTSELVAKIGSVEDGCSSLEDFKQLSSEMTASLSLSNEYLEKVNSFVEAYPREAEFVELYANPDYVEAVETNIQQVQESVALLEEACK